VVVHENISHLNLALYFHKFPAIMRSPGMHSMSDDQCLFYRRTSNIFHFALIAWPAYAAPRSGLLPRTVGNFHGDEKNSEFCHHTTLVMKVYYLPLRILRTLTHLKLECCIKWVKYCVFYFLLWNYFWKHRWLSKCTYKRSPDIEHF
jgi:hypothetical protein